MRAVQRLVKVLDPNITEKGVKKGSAEKESL